MVVEQIPTPTPNADLALVRIRYSGVCGADVHGYTGESGRRRVGMVMGHEIAGIVVASPDPSFRAGDAVAVYPRLACRSCRYCLAELENHCTGARFIGLTPDIQGGYADFIAVPTSSLVRLPSQDLGAVGSMVEPFAVGLRAARLCPRGQAPILILGGGPVGLCTALALVGLGVDGLALYEASPERRELLSRVGLDGLEILSSLPDRQWPVVLDSAGTSGSFESGLTACASQGVLVFLGMSTPRITFPAYPLVVKELVVKGSFNYTRGEFEEAASEVGRWAAQLARAVSAEVSFYEMPALFERLATGREHGLKYVLAPEIGAEQ
jgi:threonine dehydrogenase-like Zn-dependent dehydrogenase